MAASGGTWKGGKFKAAGGGGGATAVKQFNAKTGQVVSMDGDQWRVSATRDAITLSVLNSDGRPAFPPKMKRLRPAEFSSSTAGGKIKLIREAPEPQPKSTSTTKTAAAAKATPRPVPRSQPRTQSKPFPNAMMTSTGRWVTPAQWDIIEGNM